MRADGTIVIDTKINTDGVEAGVEDINKAASNMARRLKGFVKTLGTLFAVGKIVEFSDACLDLGSNLQEVQNVVDNVFPNMRDKVEEFAESAAMTAGLSETMAKQYTGTFGAMAESFGFSEDSAYNMSTALTQLSGDVASFYNLTQDEAYTKLKSVFTGETESLKDLGVVMTQSALDSYALANGYNKTTKAMSEQEKVALRYNFVMNQLSTASGDFIRTSDGWANQIRVLKLQFESLRATIGQGLINILTPVIKVVNTIIARLVTLANMFHSFSEALTGRKGGDKGISLVAENMESAAESSGITTSNMEDIAAAVKKVNHNLAGFDKLNVLSSQNSSADISSGGGGVDIPSFGSGAIMAPIIDTTNMEASVKRIKNIMNDLKNSLLTHKDEVLTVIGGLLAGIGTYLLGANGNGIINGIITAFNGLKSGIVAAISGISPVALGVAAVVGAFAAEVIYLWNTSEQFRDVVISAWNMISSAVKSAWSHIWNNGLKPIGKALVDLGESICRFYEASGLKKLFELAVTGIIGIASVLGSTLILAVSGAVTTIMQAIELLISGLTKIFNKATWLFQNWKTIFANLRSMFLESLNGIMKFITGTFTSMWSRAWTKVGDILCNVFNGIVKIVEKAINYIVKGLNNLSFDVPEWSPIAGGAHFGFAIPEVHLPRLASGTVVPPRAGEFAAILGDNRRETEVVSPLSTMKRALKEALMESGLNDNSGTINLVVNLDGKAIYKTVVDINRAEKRRTGKNLLLV